MTGLNENVLECQLTAIHDDRRNHSLICDSDFGEKYRVRMDVYGKDHRRDADAIIARVNGYDALVTVLCGRLGLDPATIKVIDGRVFVAGENMIEVTP